MVELITREKDKNLVYNAGYKTGIVINGDMDEGAFKSVLAEIVYTAINSIDKEALRKLINEND